MDFIQVFQSFVGSFFGFGFALLTQFLLTKINGLFNVKKVKGSIEDELRHIYEGYYDEKSECVETGKIFITTPVWDSLLSTGDILVMLEKDRIYYDKVLSVYCTLKAIEKMEAENNSQYATYIQEDKEYVVSKIRNILK